MQFEKDSYGWNAQKLHELALDHLSDGSNTAISCIRMFINNILKEYISMQYDDHWVTDSVLQSNNTKSLYRYAGFMNDPADIIKISAISDIEFMASSEADRKYMYGHEETKIMFDMADNIYNEVLNAIKLKSNELSATKLFK